jgi:transposase
MFWTYPGLLQKSMNQSSELSCHRKLEINSNLAENSIRLLALGCKNFLLTGSNHAAKNIAMFYSFFGTCSKLDIDPQKWLEYGMENIHITPVGNFTELLPQFIDKSLLQE